MTEFNIYPDNKLLYIKVYIFDTKEQMYKNDHNQRCDYEAKFTSIDHYVFKNKNDIGEKTPFMRLLFFYKDGIGSGVISHEITHATLAYTRRKKAKFEHFYRKENKKECRNEVIERDEENTEEIFAWTLGNLVSQFYKNYYKADEEY